MKNTLLIAAAIGMVLVLTMGAYAFDNGIYSYSRVPEPNLPTSGIDLAGTRLDTLWIFDADFSKIWLVTTPVGRPMTGVERSVVRTTGTTTTSGSRASRTWAQHVVVRQVRRLLAAGTRLRQPVDPDSREALHRDDRRHNVRDPGVRPALRDGEGLRLRVRGRPVSCDVRHVRTPWLLTTNPGFAGTPGRSQDWNSDYGPHGRRHQQRTRWARSST